MSPPAGNPPTGEPPAGEATVGEAAVGEAAAASPAGGRARFKAGLTARLLGAQAIVVVTGLLIVPLITALAGPALFREHLGGLGAASEAERISHAEEAFQAANLLSLALALPVALAVALLVSVLAARHLARPLASVARAASQVAAGRYKVRVPAGGMGAEFDQLAGAFNHMAGRLQSVEETRRRLLADLGHELRTPIATLDAYLEGLQDGVASFDSDTASVLRAQTARLARLAEDVSAVSRAEEHRVELRPERVGARELVEAGVGTVAAGYTAKGVDLRSEIAADCPLVCADIQRIGQVIGNLLDNALTHTPPGGRATVAARRTAEGELSIAVTDTGEGVPAEHLPHLFERFYRGDAARDRARGGSGIGLTIAKALTEAHGGRITADSPGPGRGATFTVTLPPVPSR